MTPTPVIDAHHHLWDLSRRDQAWTEPTPILHRSFLENDLAPLVVQSGVDATVLVQTVNGTLETEEFLSLAETSEFVRGVVGWVDLTSGDVADEIETLLSLLGGRRLVGMRHLVQDEVDPRWLCRPNVREGLTQLGKVGLSFDLLVRPPQLDAAIDTVRALPDVRFVLDHCGKPLIAAGEIESWRSQMMELARSDNVAVKLSGLVTEADVAKWRVDDMRPYVDVVLSFFGARRVMFGSDWPVCLLAAEYSEVVDLARALTVDLSSSENDWIFGGTARSWYGLAMA